MEQQQRGVGIVTGAGSGIGAACAARLATTVETLVLVDLRAGPLAETAADLRERLTTAARIVELTADIADPGAVAELVAELAALGPVGPVIHAAGVSPTMATWDRVLTVDLVGTALLVDALRPHCTGATRIVCIASMAAELVAAHAPTDIDQAIDDPLAPSFLDAYRAAAGEQAGDPGVAYAFAKRGVRRLVQREAVKLGPLGTRICSVSPGTINTPMGRQELERQDSVRELRDMAPLGRGGVADDIARVVEFLLSDAASFVTGIDVLVDGGVCAAIANPAVADPA